MPGPGARSFSAIAGNDPAKTAMLCTMVNPHIRCVLVSGSAGTGKTSLIRSMRSLDGSSPMVDVPIGTSEERLFGSVDIEHAMSEGTVRIDDGLFKQADGGFLCIDGIDLMDARTSLEILESSIDRVAIVERDGISASYASDARIVATTGASVRSMYRHITDRFDI